MSTDLTTTLLVEDNTGQTERSGCLAGARFIHNVADGLAIYAWPSAEDNTIVLCKEDAIMLRNWLNDEWPVVGTADVEPGKTGLWGGGSAQDIPWKGCDCDDCEEARGR